MRRSVDVDELLDGPLDDPVALRGNLRDLERVNRWLGGVALSAHGIDALASPREALTVLDVGTGAADIPVALLERAARSGRRLRITGVDSRPEILEEAVARRPRSRDVAGLELQVGDGRSLPFPDRSFDVAHASLLVHHLEPSAAVTLFREMRRVARLGIVINDLRRGRGAWLGAWLLSHLATGNRYTRHDAPLSVRRAYTVGELTALVAAAGLRVESVRIGGPLGHRVVLVATAAPAGVEAASAGART
ncbi:MAG TPA: methyltransferase domain-containing protein [Methylomirabilota bacterium]|nr:methyltransferase domain-containing protein [Methylomirabilota bacterium]